VHLRVDQFLSILLVSLSICASGVVSSVVVASNPDTVLLIQKPDVVLPVVNPGISQPELTATSAIVIDEQSAVTLFDKNSQQQFSPASTTKLMTALVARSIFELDMALAVPSIVSALDGTRMGLVPGERLSVLALLKGTLMQSGNDAAITLASAHPAGLDGFILDMNLLAEIYHLDHTSFKNPVGYDAPEHFSTARDLALLAREAMRDPVLRNIVGTTRETVVDTTGATTHDLVSTHKLLGVDPTVIGIKTGTTEEAGEVLITQFTLKNQSIMVVVMGSKDRYSDTQALMEYVRSAVEWKTVHANSAL